MNRIISQYLAIGAAFILISCASLTPAQVNSTLPTFTKSKLLSHVQAEEAVKSERCKYLVKGRKYFAPVQVTAQGDLKKGAQGIDEWVKLDGGNAYVLINYGWVAIDDLGSSQLHLEFDTMRCE